MTTLEQDEAVWAGERIDALRSCVSSVVVGHEGVRDLLIACLIAGGHALLEDVPGVGKTLLAAVLAKSVDARFSRIQLTPDMLPADVLGVSIYEGAVGAGPVTHETVGHHDAVVSGGDRRGFRFVPGPLFANIVLADEVNRTTPRTQSALLESMNEGTVSIDGMTHELGSPFMVIATQNPFEFEGTYPLPENQLDRFLMRLSLGYPDAADEARILETGGGNGVGLSSSRVIEPAVERGEVVRLQGMCERVSVHASIRAYIVSIANATRSHPLLYLGLSPRGSLALLRSSKALALMDGRSYVIPEDVHRVAPHVIGHRVLSRDGGDGRRSGVSASVVEDVLGSVASPA